MLEVIYKFIPILLLGISILSNTFAQDSLNTISGKIIDGQTLNPLPFANIAFPNSSEGTSSDLEGDFVLRYKSENKFLIISYVGYKSLTVDLETLNNANQNIFRLFPINIFLQEVTVYSNINSANRLSEIGSLSMQSDRISEISTGMPDILRSVQSLPGIAVNNEFKANYNVRGGNQDENLILVNNATVYEPFHIKEASNASVGVFNVNLIQKVDLITGGFSARYGDKMSSVLNIQYREGNKDKYKGEASLSLAYIDGYLEGPIGNNSSFILGVRKSYLEYILKLIDYKDISSVKPAFYDIQGVYSYHFSSSNKILFEFIHAGDDFSYEPIKSSITSPRNGQYLGRDAEFSSSKIETDDYKASYFSNLFDIQSINVLSSNVLLKGELSYYKQTDNEYRFYKKDEDDNINIIAGSENYYDKIRTQRLVFDTLGIETIEMKSELAYQLSPKYEVNIGLSFQNITYNQTTDDIYTFIRRQYLNNQTPENSDTIVTKGPLAGNEPVDVHSFKYNSYIENIFQPIEKLTINAGGRIDYFDLNKELTFSPRINVGFSLTENTTLRAAWGYFYQSPTYRQLKTSSASDTNTQSQLALHYVLGIEHLFSFTEDLNNFIKFRLEGYYKEYRSLVSSYFGTYERLTYSGYNDAVGSSKGIDFQAVLNVNNFYCWLCYGLLYANEDKLTDDIGEYPRYTEQRHTLSFISSIDLGSNWRLNLNGYYGSGFPYTPRTAVNENGIWNWKSGKIHSAHLPAYRRVDVRVSKDFSFSNSTLNLFIDVSNIINFKNIQNYEYKNSAFTKPSADEVLLWPILPSFGVRYQF